MAAPGERYWSHWYSHRRWRRIRASHLLKEPLCRHCLKEGRITEATEVDHIEPHKGDRLKFWTGERQSLCPTHHSEKTAREQGKRTRRAVDESGSPDGWW